MYTLIIARGYPSERSKSYGIFEFDQAQALVKVGCKVVYAALDVRSVRHWRKWGIEHFEKNNVTIVALNIPCGRIPLKILYFIAERGLKILYSYIEKKYGPPDVMHAHFPDYAYVATKLKNKTGIRLVVTEHSSEIIKPSLVKNLNKIAQQIYDNSDAIIAVSPALSEAIEKNYGHIARYIPNMVDIDIFTYMPRHIHDGFRLVSVGNLIVRKRTDLTIEAFHQAFKNEQNVTLTIFGEGEERPFLEKLIEKYNLSQKVFLKGLCSRHEIAKNFQESDCFVLASRAETFGVAYVEAMATGLPVIATKCGGVDAFIHNGNGVLVPVDNLEDLTDGMKYMYAHAAAFDQRKISEEMHQNFSPETVSRQLIAVYESLIK